MERQERSHANMEASDAVDTKQSKQRASIKWLLSKAFNNRVPENLQEPFYRDHEDQEHLKPPIAGGMASAELYCLALANMYSDPNYHSLNHWNILQTFARKGVHVPETPDCALTETVLIQTNPLRLSAHMAVIEALMVLYAKEVVTPDRVSAAAQRFSGTSAPAAGTGTGVPHEDGLLCWINAACAALNKTQEDRSTQVSSLTRLEDACDGAALAALASFYCPAGVPRDKLRVGAVTSLADCLHNLALLHRFCAVDLPHNVFHMMPEDVTYMRGSMRQNLIAMLADLFNILEVQPIKSVKQNISDPFNAHGVRPRRCLPPPEPMPIPQLRAGCSGEPFSVSRPASSLDRRSASPQRDRDDFHVHRGRQVTTLATLLRQHEDSPEAAAPVPAGRPSKFGSDRESSFSGRRSRRNSLSDDSQLTVENFGGSQDTLHFAGRNPEKELATYVRKISAPAGPLDHNPPIRSSQQDIRGSIQFFHGDYNGEEEKPSKIERTLSQQADEPTPYFPIKRQLSSDTISFANKGGGDGFFLNRDTTDGDVTKTSFADLNRFRNGDKGHTQSKEDVNERRKSTSFCTPPPNTTTWQQQFMQQENQPNGDDMSDDASSSPGGGQMVAQLNNIRLKLEEKRRRIEQEKRRMELAVNKQRQQLGQQAFLQAVTRGKGGRTPADDEQGDTQNDQDMEVPNQTVDNVALEQYQQSIAKMNSNLQDIQSDISRLTSQQTQLHQQSQQQQYQQQQAKQLFQQPTPQSPYQQQFQQNIPQLHSQFSSQHNVSRPGLGSGFGSTPHIPQYNFNQNQNQNYQNQQNFAPQNYQNYPNQLGLNLNQLGQSQNQLGQNLNQLGQNQLGQNQLGQNLNQLGQNQNQLGQNQNQNYQGQFAQHFQPELESYHHQYRDIEREEGKFFLHETAPAPQPVQRRTWAQHAQQQQEHQELRGWQLHQQQQQQQHQQQQHQQQQHQQQQHQQQMHQQQQQMHQQQQQMHQQQQQMQQQQYEPPQRSWKSPSPQPPADRWNPQGFVLHEQPFQVHYQNGDKDHNHLSYVINPSQPSQSPPLTSSPQRRSNTPQRQGSISDIRRPDPVALRQLQTPIPAPPPDDMEPQNISFIGNAEDDALRQGINRLNISSGTRTYRIPSPTRPSLNRNSFQQLEQEEEKNEKGFYISFDNEQPKRPKPPLRVKRMSPKKEQSSRNQSPEPTPDWSDRPLEDEIVACRRSELDHALRRNADAAPTPTPTLERARQPSAEPAALVIGEVNLDPNSAEEMERKKERIMLLSLQRRQRAEEARARADAAEAARKANNHADQERKAARKAEQARRRDAILQQYKLKKAIEEAEREGKVLDQCHLESLRAAGGGSSGPGSTGATAGGRVRARSTRARPNTIHVEPHAVPHALASKQPSSTNLAAGGTMRRDYYRGSQDSLAERAGLYRESPVEDRGAMSPGSASSGPLARRGSCKTSRERVNEEPQTARGRSKYSTYQNNFKAGRKSSSLMNLCDSGLGRATPPRRAASPGLRGLASPAAASGPGSLPGAIGKRRQHHADDASDVSSTHSSIMDYSGPRLYKQPTTKSNRGIMLNAVEYCVFPGAVNAEAKRRVLEEIARSESKHFLVLFRDAGCQFRALYSYCPDTDQVTKLYGTGPKHVNDRMFDKFFKYNSGSKCFSQIHTKHLTVTIDAFTIHNSLWQGKKVQLPSKKDMALVI